MEEVLQVRGRCSNGECLGSPSAFAGVSWGKATVFLVVLARVE